MRKMIATALAFAMLATSSVTFAGTSEARHRGDRYERHHNDYYYHDRRHRRNNDAAAAAIIGLTLGAIIIGSQQNRRDRYYDNGYYRDDYRYRDSNWDHIRRCERRYRSYDRYSDTFIGRDGRRYYCNL